MNKTNLVMIGLLCAGLLAVVILFWQPAHEDRAAVLSRAEAIGHELLTQTNWPDLTFPGHIFQRRIADFVRVPAHIEAVRYGDEPRPAAEGRAACRVYLVNQTGSRLALRLKPEAAHDHWSILGWWVPESPPPSETP